MVVFGIPNVILLRAIDFLGLLMQDCLMRSTSSSDVLGPPVKYNTIIILKLILKFNFTIINLQMY
jgi:hypothetical protein